jgi:hypothetical protein
MKLARGIIYAVGVMTISYFTVDGVKAFMRATTVKLEAKKTSE